MQLDYAAAAATANDDDDDGNNDVTVKPGQAFPSQTN